MVAPMAKLTSLCHTLVRQLTSWGEGGLAAADIQRTGLQLEEMVCVQSGTDSAALAHLARVLNANLAVLLTETADDALVDESIERINAALRGILAELKREQHQQKQNCKQSPSPSPSSAPAPRPLPSNCTAAQKHASVASSKSVREALPTSSLSGPSAVARSDSGLVNDGDEVIALFITCDGCTKKVPVGRQWLVRAQVSRVSKLAMERFPVAKDSARVVYTKDPKTGVFYELENVTDLLANADTGAANELVLRAKESLTPSIIDIATLIENKFETLVSRLSLRPSPSQSSLESESTPSPTLASSVYQQQQHPQQRQRRQRCRKDAVVKLITTTAPESAPILSGPAASLHVLRSELRELREFLNTLVSETRRILAGAPVAITGAVVEALGHDQVATRVEMGRVIGPVERAVGDVPQRTCHLRERVEEVRTDLLRGRSLNTNELARLRKDVDALRRDVALVSRFTNQRERWRRCWDVEIARVVQEEQLLDAARKIAGEHAGAAARMGEVLGAMEQVVQMGGTPRASQAALDMLRDRIVPAEQLDMDEVRAGIVGEIKAVVGAGKDGNARAPPAAMLGEQRAKAVQRAERARVSTASASSTHPLFDEIARFVDEDRLSKARHRTGGLQKIEKERSERDRKLLLDLVKVSGE